MGVGHAAEAAFSRFPWNASFSFAAAHLRDTLYWLNLWHNDSASSTEFAEDFEQPPAQHLYPHP